jgi:hypothetical protein
MVTGVIIYFLASYHGREMATGQAGIFSHQNGA